MLSRDVRFQVGNGGDPGFRRHGFGAFYSGLVGFAYYRLMPSARPTSVWSAELSAGRDGRLPTLPRHLAFGLESAGSWETTRDEAYDLLNTFVDREADEPDDSRGDRHLGFRNGRNCDSLDTVQAVAGEIDATPPWLPSAGRSTTHT